VLEHEAPAKEFGQALGRRIKLPGSRKRTLTNSVQLCTIRLGAISFFDNWVDAKKRLRGGSQAMDGYFLPAIGPLPAGYRGRIGRK
jgi:hypothetical protein